MQAEIASYAQVPLGTNPGHLDIVQLSGYYSFIHNSQYLKQLCTAKYVDSSIMETWRMSKQENKHMHNIQ